MGASAPGDNVPLVPAASTAARAQQTPPLVLGHAINMASLSDQAYLEPAAGAEFQKRSANETMTQYTDADIVRAHYTAVLNVTVGQATGFKGSDWWSAPDLRVEVSAGDSYGSTTMKKNTTDPTFDETVLLWPERPRARRAAASTLNVTVYDTDCFGSDNLGTGSVALGEGWRHDNHRTETIEVKKAAGKDGKPGEAIGKVTVTLAAVPFTAAAVAEGVKKSEDAKRPGAPPAAQTPAAAAAEIPPQLEGEANATDVIAAIERPPLQVAAEASDDIRVSLAASVALDPDLSGASAEKPAHMPAAAAPAGSGAAATVELPVDQDAIEKMSEVRKGLDAIFPDSFLHESKPVAFINARSCTQAWIHRNERLKTVVISFRGTDSLTDVGTDAAATLETVVPDPATGSLRTWADAGKGAKRGWNLGPFNCFFHRSIHSGFYGAYRTVDAEVREVVDLCTRGQAGWNIITTGHSLGGALATLCAYDLTNSRDFEYDVSSYTFGSPRCGNARFASEYNRLVPRTFRMVNTHDPVPQLPPFLTYKHVDCECRIFTDPGQVALRKLNDVSLFGGPGVSRTTRDKVVKPLGLLATSTTLLRRFQRLFQTLISGELISSHRATTYMGSICQVMSAASEDATPEQQHAVRGLNEAIRLSGAGTSPSA